MPDEVTALANPDVVLLCHFDSAPFVDASSYAHTLTPIGNVIVSGANSKFGAGSAQYVIGNGTNSIDTGNTSHFWFDAAPFTIEAWCYATQAGTGDTYDPILAQWDAVLGNVGFFFNVFPHIMFFWSPDGTAYDYVDSSTTPPLNTWTHVAVDRDASNVIRIYQNGVIVGAKAMSGALFHSPLTTRIGNDNSAGRAFPGYLDEVRVVRGTAMYGGAFTPPTAPFLPADSIGVSGALTAAQAAQTISAFGGVTVRGQLAVTETADTIAAGGGIRVDGTLAATQAAQTLVAAGGPRVGGTLTVTEALDTIIATGGAVIGGTLTAAQANQILAATGGVTVRGALSVTEALDTISAFAFLPASGVLHVTQDDQILVATGTVKDRVMPTFPVYGGITDGRHIVTNSEDRMIASATNARTLASSNGSYRSAASAASRRTLPSARR